MFPNSACRVIPKMPLYRRLTDSQKLAQPLRRWQRFVGCAILTMLQWRGRRQNWRQRRD